MRIIKISDKAWILLTSCVLQLNQPMLEAVSSYSTQPEMERLSTKQEAMPPLDSNESEIPESEATDVPDWITIFVHGTIMPHLSLNNLIKILQDRVDRSEYAFTTEFIRNDPFFYQNQPIAQLGLHKIENDASAAHIFAKIFDDFGSLNSLTPVKTWYYTYGWSGLLSSRFRLKEAQIFYDRLMNEMRRFHARNHHPKIRIVSYSHGGNLALNLAAIQRECVPAYPLVISELIMIGLPVQSITDYLIRDPMFERIYHFYSLSDHVQRIDFANRRFTKSPSIKLPNQKLTQIKVKMYGVAKKSAPKTYTKQRMDPGHIELWFFGWAPQYYRKIFPCHPFPFSVLLQWLVNSIEQHAPAKDSLETNIDLSHNSIKIACYRSTKKGKCTIPFIDRSVFENAKSFALSVQPDKSSYSRQLHDKRRKWARLQASYVKQLNHKKTWLSKSSASPLPFDYRRYPCKLYHYGYIVKTKKKLPKLLSPK